MQFALVNSPDKDMLEYLSRGRSYHMALAHFVHKYPEYAEFYADESDRGAFVLLDNGVDEGERLKGERLVEAAQMCHATEVVLPDAILDYVQTHGDSKQFLVDHARAIPYVSFCYVLQARDAFELEMAFNGLLELVNLPEGRRIKSVAITKDYEAQASSRVAAVGQVIGTLHKCNLQYMDIHLLGIWNDPLEVTTIERRFPRRIRGVDSSLPLIYAFNGMYVLLSPRMGKDVDLESENLFQHFSVNRFNYLNAVDDMAALADGLIPDGYYFPTWERDASTNGE